MVSSTHNSRAKEFINIVLRAFYQKAVSDFLLGYQFRKIKEKAETTFEDIFFPELEAFSSHLARIEAFWLIQLLGEKKPAGEPPFDLIKSHAPLNIKAGELSRWVLLFKETLEYTLRDEITKSPQSQIELTELSKNWLEKVEIFQDRLKNSLLGSL